MNHVFRVIVFFIFTASILVFSESNNTFVNVNSGIAYASSISKNKEQVENFYNIDQKTESVVAPVVKLTYYIGDRGFSSATGFSIGYDKKRDISFIVTNNHFCEIYNEFPVRGTFYYSNHKKTASMGNEDKDGVLIVASTDPSKDLCLMVANGFVKPANIAPKDYKVKQMEEVTTVGAPAGVWPIFLECRLSGLFTREFLPDYMQYGDDLYMLSIQLFGGQSGSPVYNKKGQVIGVVFMNLNNKLGPVYGGLVIPLSDLHNFLDSTDIKY